MSSHSSTQLTGVGPRGLHPPCALAVQTGCPKATLASRRDPVIEGGYEINPRFFFSRGTDCGRTGDAITSRLSHCTRILCACMQSSRSRGKSSTRSLAIGTPSLKIEHDYFVSPLYMQPKYSRDACLACLCQITLPGILISVTHYHYTLQIQYALQSIFLRWSDFRPQG